MPMHDWTRVETWVYHNFHTVWIVAAYRGINARLPKGFYAMAEQSLRTMGPDVLTLRSPDSTPGQGGGSGTATLIKPATTAFAATDSVGRRPGFNQKRVVVRHKSGNQIVAIVELVSPGNKDSKQALRSFVGKIARSIQMGIHAVVLDPLPPTRRDPQGIHAAIWERIAQREYAIPTGKILTFASYESVLSEELDFRCYVEHGKVGANWPTLPLFVAPDDPVAIDFEEIYQDAYRDVLPQHRELLEAD